MSECNHTTGDWFDGIWICARCYQMLPERPTKYASGGPGGVPQVIMWQADIAVDESGTKLSTFLGWMMSGIRLRSLLTVSKHDALKMALEALEAQGERFGSKSASWTKADAKELLRECVFSYWETVGGNQ